MADLHAENGLSELLMIIFRTDAENRQAGQHHQGEIGEAGAKLAQDNFAVEQIGVKQVEEVVPGKLRDSWVSRLLSEVDPGPMTVLEWIRRPPKKRSPSTLSDAATKPPNWGALDFAAITPGRKTAYFPRFFESAAARY